VQPGPTSSVGISDQDGFTTTDLRIRRRRLLRRVAGAGPNHVTMGDHVSFHGGSGLDGMAEFLDPYVESGARHVTLIPAGRSVEAEIDAVAEVSELLRAAGGGL
jgi:hypothetical protein